MRNPRKLMMGRIVLGLALAVPALVLAACGGGTSSRTAATTINVTLSDYKIAASQTTFKTGVTYHFVVKNDGQASHELMLMSPSDDAGGMGGMGHMDHDALYTISVNDLPPGATRAFDYTFTQRGQPEFACHVGDHYQMGMHLPLTVSNG